MSTKPNTNQQTINKTTTVIASDEPKPSSEKQKENASDRRFNIVMYGVKESPANTNRSTRLDQDLFNITHAFSQTNLPLERQSIKDCCRLGKFNSNAIKPRPILVSFLRSIDASMALSKISEFKSSIRIKPDLSPEERAQESVLLKERWSLIDPEGSRKKTNQTEKQSLVC